MLRIGTIVLGAADVRRAAMFWVQALDYLPRGEVADDWAVLVPADGRPGPGLSLGRSETPVQEYPRVHLDLYAADQAAEVERLVALGAARVDWDRYEEGSDFVVLADTEGNRFCVIDTGGQRQPPQQPLGSVASSP
ncbi:MAG: VOC family protein [Acidimicrobiales bacterium]